MKPEPLDHDLSPVWCAHFQEVLQRINLIQQQIAVNKGTVLELQEALALARNHISIVLAAVAEAEGLPKLEGVQYILSADGTKIHRRSA